MSASHPIGPTLNTCETHSIHCDNHMETGRAALPPPYPQLSSGDRWRGDLHRLAVVVELRGGPSGHVLPVLALRAELLHDAVDQAALVHPEAILDGLVGILLDALGGSRRDALGHLHHRGDELLHLRVLLGDLLR